MPNLDRILPPFSNSNKDEASMFEARFPVTRDKMWLRTNIASNPPITIHRHTAVKPTDLAELFSSIWTLLGAGFARAFLFLVLSSLSLSLSFFPHALDFILRWKSKKHFTRALFQSKIHSSTIRRKKKIDSTISSRSLSFLTIDRYTCHEEKIVIGRLNQPETAQGQRWICRIDSVEHRWLGFRY